MIMVSLTILIIKLITNGINARNNGNLAYLNNRFETGYNNYKPSKEICKKLANSEACFSISFNVKG